MRHEFDPNHGLILVPADLTGPQGVSRLRLVLDTGATTTLIRPVHLRWLGYDLETAGRPVKMTTGSAVEVATQLPVERIDALGLSRTQFLMIAHELPTTAPFDGLLGLDFFRHTRLELNLREGYLCLLD